MKKRQIIILALCTVIVLLIAGIVFMVYTNNKKDPAPAESSTQTTMPPTAVTSELESSSLPTTAETPTPTLKPTATPTATATPTPTPAIADGTYQAYITGVSTIPPDANNLGTVTIRLAPIFGGAEAVARAKADGYPEIIEVDENGVEYIAAEYYISDADQTLHILPVSTGSSIRVFPPEGLNDAAEDFCVDGTLSDLAAHVTEYQQYATVTVKNGSVSSVVEFYLP